MKISGSKFLPIFCAVILGTTAAHAQVLRLNDGDVFASEFSEIEQAAILRLARTLNTSVSWDILQTRLRGQFSRLDPEADGISKLDQSEEFLIGSARRRANRLREWINFDLDGDGNVADSELRIFANQPLVPPRSGAFSVAGISVRPTPEQSDRIYAAIKDRLNLPDPNQDGISSFAEMLSEANAEEAARKQDETQPNRFGFLPAVSFVFDANQDGIVTEDEFLVAKKQGFDAMDEDGDGQLSLQEVKRLRNARDAIVRSLNSDD